MLFRVPKQNIDKLASYHPRDDGMRRFSQRRNSYMYFYVQLAHEKETVVHSETFPLYNSSIVCSFWKCLLTQYIYKQTYCVTGYFQRFLYLDNLHYIRS